MTEKCFNGSKQLMISEHDYNTKNYKTFFIIIVLSFLLFIPFLGGKKTIVYTPIQGKIQGKVFQSYYLEVKNADSGGN